MKNLRLLINAQKANPKPPIGSILGQYSINLMDFCKEFNALSQKYKTNYLIPTNVIILNDKSFKINLNNPSPIYLLKSNNLLKKEIDIRIIYELCQLYKNLKLCNSIIGTLKNMGIKIKKI